MQYPDTNSGILIFPRYRTLAAKIAEVIRIWAVLLMVFLLSVFFLPAQTCKPIFIVFLVLNTLCIILLYSRLRAFNRLKEELRLLLAHTENLMCTMDSQLVVTGICGQVEHITGRESAQFMNSPFTSILSVSDLEYFNGCVRENKTFSMECTIDRGTKRPLPVRIVVSPVHGLGQDAFQGVVKDLSDQKKNQHFEKQLKEWEKLKNIGVIAGSVAHDLNNILAGMATYPEVLTMNNALPSGVRESLEIIKESGQKASCVVSDLLTISRGIKADRQIMNVNRVVQRFMAAPEFENIQQANPETSLEVNLDPELLNISGSYIHIEKAIMNLLEHCFERVFSTEDGNIVLTTANFYVNETNVLYTEKDMPTGEYVMLEVSDNGPDWPKHCLKRIFDPFFVQKELGLPGTGLGLTVVLNTVQDHRGDVQVASSPHGTRFTMLLPAIRAEIVAASEPLSLDQITGNGETILVVDDLSTQRKIAEAILNRLNYRVFSVAEGFSAIEFVKQTPVDLILMDVFLGPGLSGLEALRQIREINPGQKAVIASGHSESEEVLKVQEFGKDTFIKKPFTVMDMGIAVKEELDG